MTKLATTRRAAAVRPLVALTACALSATGLQAAELDLNLNDDAAKLSYAADVSDRNLRVDGGVLHHQDRGDVLHIGLNLIGDASPGANPVTGGLGGRLIYADADLNNRDAVYLGIGGFLRYTLPTYDRFSVYGHLYYAPDVLAFGDGDRYQEAEARVSYNVLRQADLYLGVRYSNARFDNAGSQTIDNGLHIGIQLRF
jgi:hypothetical protein